MTLSPQDCDGTEKYYINTILLYGHIYQRISFDKYVLHYKKLKDEKEI